MDRRKFLAQAAFTGVAALEAVIDWRFSPPSAAPAQAAGTVTVHEGDVERLRRARVEFADLDHAHGGGHALGWLQQYLHQEVAPLLQGRYRDKIGRNLFLAAATLSNVAGWMAMDAGQHGLGQRHYTQAIALAKHAGADAFAACASGNLATQALFLGQTQTAIRLTRAALDSSTSLPAALIAQIATTEARAHALTGDAYETMRLLREADEAMTRAQPEADPEWLAPWTEAHHAGGAMHALRDLGRVAEAQQRASDALAAPSGNVRTRALHQVLQASVLARSGELDGACETATEVRNSAAGLRSKRLNQRLAELMELLDEHQDVGVVRDFFAASR
ncbi:hypothetical protein [Sinosporangium album]|uniref:hypothetical protein n=1 Tax=Sinosporangium album TaxID=504805 RepID=UPI00115F9F17|nr:hypothetical protein [Sinosporangium album]